MGKFYAVKSGRENGIFLTWAECEKQVKGFSGAQYKSFSSKQDALAYLEEKQIVVDDVHGLIAYVDGSYNKKTKEYGYGCVLIEGQTVIKKLYGKGNHPDYAAIHNVAGEIIGATVAVKYAIEHGYSLICIYYDYFGIEKWATKQWQATKEKTKEYQKFMQDSQKKIKIYFMKVEAHTGVVYNVEADKLAKKAVGIQWVKD